MKKLLTLLISIAFLIGLAGCENQHVSVDIDLNTNEDFFQDYVSTDVTAQKVETDGDEVEPDKDAPVTEAEDEKIEFALEKFLTVYSEGLMFAEIETEDEYGVTACIDKQGHVVFTLDDEYTVWSGFCNGLAVLAEGNSFVLCDKTGKIVRAKDVGASYFVYGNPKNNGLKNVACESAQEAFADGYILAVKNTTSYQGSVNELAVFNSNLEKIVDFSVELFDFYADSFTGYGKGSTYYNGFIFNKGIGYYDEWGYINLNTGEFSEKISELSSKITLKNKSDLWIVQEGWGKLYFCSALKNIDTPELDITKYTEVSGRKAEIISINNAGSYGDLCYGYEDGNAAMLFTVGGKYYFTLLDEAGEFCFEPVEIYGKAKAPKYDNGVYAFCTYTDHSTAVVQVFDKSGEIAKKVFKTKSEWVYSYYWSGKMDEIAIGDGVICLELEELNSTNLYVLGTDLEPLY